MRRPATEAELERIDVTPEDIEHFKGMMNRVSDRVHRVGLNEEDPNVGVAMLRAGVQAAVVLGLPVEDVVRMVVYACDLFEPPGGKAPVFPALIDGAEMNALSRRCAFIACGALRNEAPTDQAAACLYVGVSIIRFAAHATDTVLELLTACWKDAERAMVAAGAARRA